MEAKMMRILTALVNSGKIDDLVTAYSLADALLNANSWERKLSEEALDFCDELMTAIHEEIGF